MELQIPHRVCTEIQKKNLLQGKETGSRKNPENALRVEESKNCGIRSMPGSRAHAGRDPA